MIGQLYAEENTVSIQYWSVTVKLRTNRIAISILLVSSAVLTRDKNKAVRVDHWRCVVAAVTGMIHGVSRACHSARL